MRILVVNAGSSSLKLSVLGDDDRLVETENLPPSGGDALRDMIARGAPIDAVGHRIVHGGASLVRPVLVSPDIRRQLGDLTSLAPLHQPKSLEALDLVTAVLPDTPAVACFDTAFHATLPDEAATYAIPAVWRARWGLRRYGFHGLSHAYAARRAAAMASPALRVVTCHLGAGASLAAVERGASVDTTMGFTPLEGLVMATRSGNVDPGLVLWLQEQAGLPPSELASALEHRSGLSGLAGTPDMRAVIDADATGDPAATLAFGVYLHRLRGQIAAMAAAMGGLDTLVFTGGVGEHAPEVRRRAAEGLGFLGVAIDSDANQQAVADHEITASGADVRTLVVEAREDLEIAHGVRDVLD